MHYETHHPLCTARLGPESLIGQKGSSISGNFPPQAQPEVTRKDNESIVRPIVQLSVRGKHPAGAVVWLYQNSFIDEVPLVQVWGKTVHERKDRLNHHIRAEQDYLWLSSLAPPHPSPAKGPLLAGSTFRNSDNSFPKNSS